MTDAGDADVATSGYLISAPWRSSGKTAVTMGLARAAQRRKLTVQTFKKGPDYIDPLWLGAASGRGCYNLDPWLQADDELLTTFNKASPGALSLVEGTMGLHDGLQSDGSDSNAAIARLLKLPVILVVDCRGMHRTVAALINGIQQFDSQVRYAGVILNRLRSDRHAHKIRTALRDHCDIKLLGEIPEADSIHIEEKQLGLMPAPELNRYSRQIDNAADLISANCDLADIFSNTETATAADEASLSATVVRGKKIRVGVAQDEAFHFYYQDDLDTLRERGVELIVLSPLRDKFPDNLDGLLIGGGFPERYAEALMQNRFFRESLSTAIHSGLVVHAECGGLMYLCRSLILDDGVFDMVGVFDADVTMCEKPQGRGYMKLRHLHDDSAIAAHEFHHSSISFDQPLPYTYAVERGYGIDGEHDGVIFANTYASYAHFRHTRASPWIDGLMDRIKQQNNRHG